MYNLSQQTIKMTERKDSKVFQVFECVCPQTGSRNGREVFGDDDKDEFDTNYYKKDVVDWAESQLLRVSDCKTLVVSLGADTPNALHKTISKSNVTVLIENVEDLEISNLDIGYGITGSNVREKVTSLILRNIVVTKTR